MLSFFLCTHNYACTGMCTCTTLLRRLCLSSIAAWQPPDNLVGFDGSQAPHCDQLLHPVPRRRRLPRGIVRSAAGDHDARDKR